MLQLYSLLRPTCLVSVFSCFVCNHLVAQVSATKQLVQDGTFESQGQGWVLKQRSSVWAVKDASPDTVQVIQEQGNTVLRFKAVTLDNFQATYASQFISIQSNHSEAQVIKVSVQVKGSDGQHLRVLLDIRYQDGSLLNSVLQLRAPPTDNSFSSLCEIIPNYGSVKSMMLHLVLESSISSGFDVDNVSISFSSYISKKCSIYSRSVPKRRQVFHSFLQPVNKPSTDYQITLVTQMTLDRFTHLKETTEVWKGPISVAILLTKSDDIGQLIQDYYSTTGLQSFVTCHLVLADSLNNEDATLYPTNFLRNIAISLVSTPLSFYVDVDIAPGFSYSQAIQWYELAKSKVASTEDPKCRKCAFITPTFHLTTVTHKLPTSKSELLSVVHGESKEIEPFLGVSHSSVQYHKWYTAEEVYEIQYQMDMEPYFIIASDSPLMSDLYVGYGRDKCAYSYDLHSAGYHFYVLPQAFILNKKEHPGSKTIYERSHGLQLKVFLNIMYHHAEVATFGPLPVSEFLQNLAAIQRIEPKDIPVAGQHCSKPNCDQSDETNRPADIYSKQTDISNQQDEQIQGKEHIHDQPLTDERNCKNEQVTEEDIANNEIPVRGNFLLPTDRKDVLIEKVMNTYGTYLYIEMPSPGAATKIDYKLVDIQAERIVMIKTNATDNEEMTDGFYLILNSPHDVQKSIHFVRERDGSNTPCTVFINGTGTLKEPQILEYVSKVLHAIKPSDVVLIHLPSSESLSLLTGISIIVCETATDWQMFHSKGSQSHFIMLKHKDLSKPSEKKITPPPVMIPSQLKDLKSDIILITKNRPMQTLAFLESLVKYVSGINKVWVITKTESQEFLAAYKTAVACAVHGEFEVKIIQQDEDLGDEVTKILRVNTMSCAMLAVDEIIWLHPADLKFACNLLRQNSNKISTFQFRLGKNIAVFNQRDSNQHVYVEIDNDLFIHYAHHWPYDFGYILHIDGFFTRREQLLRDIEAVAARIDTPGVLESGLIKHHLHTYCRQWHAWYGTARFVNNMSLQDGRVANSATVSQGSKDLLERLVKTKEKIDIDKFKERNGPRIVATHMILEVDFIPYKC